jgi:osmoprotectant transport system permease protein
MAGQVADTVGDEVPVNGFLNEVIAWFTEEGRWLSDDGILPRTLEHLWLAILPMVIAIAVAIPLAVWLGHKRVWEFSANTLVNIGRAIPSFGLLVLAAVLFLDVGVSLRFWPAVVALVALAIPPIFTNSYTAITTVPAETVEAGRGMGLTESQILREVEVPVGAPVILAGVRISLIQVLATVPLAAVLSSGGGLGQYVVRGFAQGRGGVIDVFCGAVLIAVLTLAADRIFSLLEVVLLPPGVKRLSDTDVRASASIS